MEKLFLALRSAKISARRTTVAIGGSSKSSVLFQQVANKPFSRRKSMYKTPNNVSTGSAVTGVESRDNIEPINELSSVEEDGSENSIEPATNAEPNVVPNTDVNYSIEMDSDNMVQQDIQQNSHSTAEIEPNVASSAESIEMNDNNSVVIHTNPNEENSNSENSIVSCNEIDVGSIDGDIDSIERAELVSNEPVAGKSSNQKSIIDVFDSIEKGESYLVAFGIQSTSNIEANVIANKKNDAPPNMTNVLLPFLPPVNNHHVAIQSTSLLDNFGPENDNLPTPIVPTQNAPMSPVQIEMDLMMWSDESVVDSFVPDSVDLPEPMPPNVPLPLHHLNESSLKQYGPVKKAKKSKTSRLIVDLLNNYDKQQQQQQPEQQNIALIQTIEDININQVIEESDESFGHIIHYSDSD